MLVNLNLEPTRKQLKEFGLIALVAFGILGAVVSWRGGLFGVSFGASAATVSYVLWGLAALSGLFAAAAPAANRPLFVLLSVVAFPIGIIVSHVALALLFFGILTPVALFFRLIGRDPLARSFEPDRESYWVDLPQTEDDAATRESYFRQF